jgi:glycopeptide antibiotics resistance protein
MYLYILAAVLLVLFVLFKSPHLLGAITPDHSAV